MIANAIVQELKKGSFAYSRVCINQTVVENDQEEQDLN